MGGKEAATRKGPHPPPPRLSLDHTANLGFIRSIAAAWVDRKTRKGSGVRFDCRTLFSPPLISLSDLPPKLRASPTHRGFRAAGRLLLLVHDLNLLGVIDFDSRPFLLDDE